ncbi:hypothetical protein Barb6XT_00535 [Bacteroidales bacterium Barb6XT]|nr:hypothetical protein Barb6XT_01084 [Bacteroidales bacterium Barb6XT]OAV69360.1 hypothetical protein Barb6XT_00535 [Bacteroidales bacterium Barb6XT]
MSCKAKQQKNNRRYATISHILDKQWDYIYSQLYLCPLIIRGLQILNYNLSYHVMGKITLTACLTAVVCLSALAQTGGKTVIKVATDEVSLTFQVGENGRLYQTYFGQSLRYDSEAANLPLGDDRTGNFRFTFEVDQTNNLRGLYSVLDRIATKYPTVLMMLCSGGGQTFSGDYLMKAGLPLLSSRHTESRVSELTKIP